MPAEAQEKFDSLTITTGRSPSVELRYVIRGTDDYLEARTALADACPVSFDPWGDGLAALPRESLMIEPVGGALWEGVVRYAPALALSAMTLEFDTSGGVQHITQSKATVARYPAGSAPDFEGAIGVTADAVDGVDIVVPVYQFSLSKLMAGADVTPAYRGTLFHLTGKVNNGPFQDFAAGEVLFLGAAGTRRGSGEWELSFRFAASPNAANLTIGALTGINKGGWEYLWVRYADALDAAASALTKRPIAAYVERVYDTGDFALLGLE